MSSRSDPPWSSRLRRRADRLDRVAADIEVALRRADPAGGADLDRDGAADASAAYARRQILFSGGIALLAQANLSGLTARHLLG
ncbi:MAG: hypothetical protein HY302_12480 [Opitutae bacterium]|nr:hypothetical protein [Opitutae bacterium]